MSRFLITGGTGFVGSSVARALRAEGHEVIFASRVRHHNTPPQHWIEYDLRDPATVANMISAKPDGIFHLAWSSTPGSAEIDPFTDVRVNLGGTVAFFQELSERLPVPIVFTSSGGTVYGIPETLPIPEEHPLRPIGIYGITKAVTERYAENYFQRHDLDVRVARLSNPFGSHQSVAKLQGAASIFARRITQRERVTIWGDGSVIRDYIHVDDVSRALIAIMKMERLQKEAGMPIFNVGSGHGVSLKDLIDMIGNCAGIAPEVSYVEGRPFDIQENVLDVSRIRAHTGWTPVRNVQESIRLVVEELISAGK